MTNVFISYARSDGEDFTRDPEAFYDGILWVTLGESPDDLTGRVEDLIDILSSERSGFAGLDAAASRLVELLADRHIQTLEGHTKWVIAVAVTPDGKHAISGSIDNTLRVWDIKTGQTIASFSGDGYLHACAISLNSRTIVAGGASGRVHFLRLQGAE